MITKQPLRLSAITAIDDAHKVRSQSCFLLHASHIGITLVPGETRQLFDKLVETAKHFKSLNDIEVHRAGYSLMHEELAVAAQQLGIDEHALKETAIGDLQPHAVTIVKTLNRIRLQPELISLLGLMRTSEISSATLTAKENILRALRGAADKVLLLGDERITVAALFVCDDPIMVHDIFRIPIESLRRMHQRISAEPAEGEQPSDGRRSAA